MKRKLKGKIKIKISCQTICDICLTNNKYIQGNPENDADAEASTALPSAITQARLHALRRVKEGDDIREGCLLYATPASVIQDFIAISSEDINSPHRGKREERTLGSNWNQTLYGSAWLALFPPHP